MQSSWSFYRDAFQRYLRPQIGKLFLLALLLFVNSSVALAPAQVLRIYIDAVQQKSLLTFLLMIASVYLGCVLLSMVINVGITYLSEKVSWVATNSLRETLMQHCLHLDMSFHNEHTPGELIERIDGDVSLLANFFSQFILQVVNNLILLIGTLLLLTLTDWRLGAVFSCFALVTLIAMSKVRHIAIPHWKAARQASAQFFGFLEERLAGREDIRSSAATEYVMHQFYRLLQNSYRLEKKAGVMGSTLGATTVICFTFGYVLAFSLGAYLYHNGALTLGGVYLLYQYVLLLEKPVQQITTQLDDLQMASAGISRTRELLQTKSTLSEGRDGDVVPGPLAITFQNVSFGYQPEQKTLNNLSFHLKAGDVLAVVGRTGSGKSTLVRLLLRLYEPTAGTILLGDTSITVLPLSLIRNSVGFVTQDIQFFHATVRDNLTFFDRAVPDIRIHEALIQVGLNEWYQKLPEGLDTILKGSQGLSTGEAQLLALTRVFLKDPQIVILDEASSHLDPVTEQKIECAIDCLLQNRTAIIIAHHLATIERATQIIVLKDGQIVEQGNPLELQMQSGSQVAHLFAQQREEFVA